ncbi:hypothetical protein WN51_14009 [Melipona quadrifasciata]|uniref:Uncharacterized protein n=1 Tax=Melipona quadrifasciata TaxID=166423 RepID=A0A0N0BFW9_9HYME|nr:hypothetical protein WN51_14009 [Melipona quadrifasciata]
MEGEKRVEGKESEGEGSKEERLVKDLDTLQSVQNRTSTSIALSIEQLTRRIPLVGEAIIIDSGVGSEGLKESVNEGLAGGLEGSQGESNRRLRRNLPRDLELSSGSFCSSLSSTRRGNSNADSGSYGERILIIVLKGLGPLVLRQAVFSIVQHDDRERQPTASSLVARRPATFHHDVALLSDISGLPVAQFPIDDSKDRAKNSVGSRRSIPISVFLNLIVDIIPWSRFQVNNRVIHRCYYTLKLISCTDSNRRYSGPVGSYSGPQLGLVSVSRHAGGGRYLCQFFIAPRAEWKQYVTGGKGVKPVYEVLVGGPGLPAPNVNTNASAVTAPHAPCHDFK